MQNDLRILVVDDDRASCLLLRKMITSLGYTCDFVHNVADGLRAAACKDYALVLIDSFLPDNSGMVAFSAIKLLPREGPAPAFIGIMSSQNEQMQCQLVSAGMAGVLAKPFYRTAVGERIGQALSHERGPTTCCVDNILFQGFSEGDAERKDCANGHRCSRATHQSTTPQSSVPLYEKPNVPDVQLESERHFLFNSFGFTSNVVSRS
jgi:CheY-like chemotaxis protein